MSTMVAIVLFSYLVSGVLAVPQDYKYSRRNPDYSPATTSSDPNFLRGVNVGGWLILEKWMNSEVFTGSAAAAVDQWTFDSTYGASDALQQHWSTYFTEADVYTLKSYGFNAFVQPLFSK